MFYSHVTSGKMYFAWSRMWKMKTQLMHMDHMVTGIKNPQNLPD